jgi:mannosyltransferase
MDKISLEQQKDTIPRSYAWIAVLGIVMLAAALRAYHLGFHVLWYDETFTAWVVAENPAEILSITLDDVVHPPLYYVLLSYWTLLAGNSEFILRTLSAAISLLGVPLLYQLGWRGWNRQTGLAAALLWACSPFAVWYAQEARMYAMLTIVGLAATLSLARALPEGSGRWLATNALLNLVGLYTHYFYLFLILAQYLYLAFTLRRHRRAFWRWFLANGVVALLYLPWGLTILRGRLSGAQIAWVPALSLGSVWQTLWEFSVGKEQPLSAPGAFMTLVLIGGLTSSAVAGRGKRDATVRARGDSPIPGLVWTCLLVPPILVALISLRQPLFYSRFLQIILPAFLLLAAAGLMRIPRPEAGAILVGLVALSGITALNDMYSMPARHDHDWRAAMDYLASNAEVDDLIAFRGGQGSHGYWYYYDGPPARTVNLRPEQGLEDLSTQATGSRRTWLVIWDPARSCKAPDQFVPGPQNPLELDDTECFPEITIVSYGWREQGEQ